MHIRPGMRFPVPSSSRFGRGYHLHPATAEKGPLPPPNLRLDLCTYPLSPFVESGHVTGKLASPWGENRLSLYRIYETDVIVLRQRNVGYSIWSHVVSDGWTTYPHNSRPRTVSIVRLYPSHPTSHCPVLLHIQTRHSLFFL
jgi:hypothetical protein